MQTIRPNSSSFCNERYRDATQKLGHGAEMVKLRVSTTTTTSKSKSVSAEVHRSLFAWAPHCDSVAVLSDFGCISTWCWAHVGLGG